MSHENAETTEVLICGCGPTGALLSTTLAQLGVANVCIEKEASIAQDPRGIALDEDGIRALQGVGLLDKVYSEIGRCMGMFKFVGDVHSDLSKEPFMQMDYGTSEGGTGHVGFICHKQPVLERNLRQRMEESGLSELRTSCTLSSIDEDVEWVYVRYCDAEGREHRIQARFLVGADGKTGFTRKMYLEQKGILMQQISESGSYAETWVAMNLKLTLPTPNTHPDWPLWRRGYTPEQVYDLFFPPNFRFLCNPDRPAVCGRFGQPDDRLWRFEFVVRDGEDGTEMASEASIKKIVFPYLQHPGHRYGLSGDVTYPEDCIEILRARPFFFSARSCNSWALGRTILCGDSAHVFPPYGGQGIVSGFRDAVALAWRLKIACQRLPQGHDALLRAWYQERKQQLEHSLAATVENGRYVTERNPIRILIRNTYLSLLQLLPSWRRWLEKGARREGACRYTYRDGLHFLARDGGGVLLPQVYCRSVVPRGSTVQFTDDIVHATEKLGLFQLVVLLKSASEVGPIIHQLGSFDIDELSSGFVKHAEITVIIHDLTATLSEPQQRELETQSVRVVRTASSSEFEVSPLCNNRPAPRHYDPYRIAAELPGKTFVIVRPDRFTFAACATAEELCEVLRLIEPVLQGQRAD